MKRKLVLLIGVVLLALVVSTGTFAYTYSTASTMVDVYAVGGDIVASEPASEQPPWEESIPEIEYDVEVLLPNAQGSYTSLPFQYPSGGEHWDKVNQDDQWETYVYSDKKTYKKDLYNLDNHEYGEGEIESIIVYFTFAGYTDGGDHTAYAKAAIKTHDKVYEGNEESQTGDEFITSMYQWSANPKTGEAWTWDEIDALEAGVSLKGEGHSSLAYCTQVYVMVEFIVPPELQGEVLPGDIFIVNPHPEYDGDLTVNLYITNTNALSKAFLYLNLKTYMENSLEAGKDPDYQVLSLENGVAQFNIEGGVSDNYTIEVTGGSYNLMSGDPDEWGDGWSVIPEFYCEVGQR